MAEIILYQTRYVQQFAEAVKQLGVAAFFVGPPPIRRQYIERHLGCLTEAEAVQLQMLFWTVIGASLDALSVPYVLAPPETSINGVMRPEFGSIRGNDDYHGNAEYGSRIWRHIAARIEAGTFPIVPIRDPDIATSRTVQG